MSAFGTQVGGDHYKKQKIQPIEYIFANDLGFAEGNVVKYVSRWRDKGGIQDLEKAKHYLELLIEEERRKEREVAAREAAKYSHQWSMPDGEKRVFPVAVTYEEALEQWAAEADEYCPAENEDYWAVGGTE